MQIANSDSAEISMSMDTDTANSNPKEQRGCVDKQSVSYKNSSTPPATSAAPAAGAVAKYRSGRRICGYH